MISNWFSTTNWILVSLWTSVYNSRPPLSEGSLVAKSRRDEVFERRWARDLAAGIRSEFWRDSDFSVSSIGALVAIQRFLKCVWHQKHSELSACILWHAGIENSFMLEPWMFSISDTKSSAFYLNFFCRFQYILIVSFFQSPHSWSLFSPGVLFCETRYLSLSLLTNEQKQKATTKESFLLILSNLLVTSFVTREKLAHVDFSSPKVPRWISRKSFSF